MKKDRHFVIGDVHGEYNMLLELVERLPKNAKLIFVGDLVNRGKKSREVIAFVKERAFAVVRGNHEGYMLEHGKQFLDSIAKCEEPNLNNIWMYVGGVPMLQSYGLLKQVKDNPYVVLKKPDNIETLKRDLEWIESLPIYLELGNFDGYELPIVISHGSIGNFWYLKDSKPKHLEFYALSNRNRPSPDAPIFNIYGHVNVESVVIGQNFASIDTGCGKSHGAKLSAFCIETKEVIEVFKEFVSLKINYSS